MSTENGVFPYLMFGKNLWQARESIQIRSREMAEALGVNKEDYQLFESGNRIPDMSQMATIATLLKRDMTEVLSWIQQKPGTNITTTAESVSPYWDILEKEIGEVEVFFSHRPGFDKFSHEIMNQLRGHLKQLFVPAILPMNALLVLDTIDRGCDRGTLLKNLKSIISGTETFAEQISRDPSLAPFLYYAVAQKGVKQSKPSSFKEAIDEMTLGEFVSFLLITIEQKGIFSQSRELASFQEQFEFTSLAAMMVREMNNSLKGYVNPEHLFQATLCQNIGLQAIYMAINPGDQIKNISCLFPKGNLNQFEEWIIEFTEMAIWHIHPVASALIAEHWGLSKEVIEAILTHHEPLEEVSPLCSLLKVVSWITDQGFRASHELLKGVFEEKIPFIKDELTSAFCKTANDIYEKKNLLIEMSSTIMEEKQASVVTYTSQMMSKMNDQKADSQKTHSDNHFERSDFRFDPAYQSALVSEAQMQVKAFEARERSRSQNESLDSYLKRCASFEAKKGIILAGDLKKCAEQLKMSEEEILKLLDLKL